MSNVYYYTIETKSAKKLVEAAKAELKTEVETVEVCDEWGDPHHYEDVKKDVMVIDGYTFDITPFGYWLSRIASPTPVEKLKRIQGIEEVHSY